MFIKLGSILVFWCIVYADLRWHDDLKANLKRPQDVFIVHKQHLSNGHQRMITVNERSICRANSLCVLCEYLAYMNQSIVMRLYKREINLEFFPLFSQLV